MKAHRNDFVPVLPRGVNRRHALLAKATMHPTDAKRIERTVYAGQLISRDDPMVVLHPTTSSYRRLRIENARRPRLARTGTSAYDT